MSEKFNGKPMTTENQRDEDLKRYDSKYGHFIKWDDFIAQRQSWEREKELDSHILAIDDANTRAQDEITRLKSRNEELVAENERLRDFSKSYDVTENSVYQEAKKEISRLSSALGAAHEALKQVDDLINESRGVVGLHLNGDEASWDWLYQDWLSDLPDALADPTGQLAFEKLKKLKELFEASKDIAENEVPSDEQWKRFEAAVKALEALDAKGERE